MSVLAFTQRAFVRFDRGAQRLLGVDMRLLYGMAVPVVAIGLLIAVLFGYAPSTWTVIALMVVEVILLGVVLCGFTILLRDVPDDEDADG